MTLIKSLTFILAYIGYYLFSFNQKKIKEAFIPFLLNGLVTLFFFLMGILNLLKIGLVLFALVGFGCFCIQIKKMVCKEINFEVHWGSIIYFAISLAYFFFFQGSVLTHYDNFSHWGVIVKEMAMNHRFPNFKDDVIAFQTYPPATACFIYPFTSFFGYSEGVALWGQFNLLLSCCLTFLAWIKKEKNIPSIFLVAVVCVFLLSGNIGISNLLVDNILPIAAIATLNLFWFYRDEFEKIEKVYFIPLTLIVLIKNTGLFYYGVILFLILVYQVKKKRFSIKKIGLSVVLPLLVLLLWNQHVDLVFSNPSISNHSMSTENFKLVLQNRDLSAFYDVTKIYLSQTLNFQNFCTMAVVGFNILFLLDFFINKNKKIGLLLYADLVYGLWLVALLATYLVSMPVNAAYSLAGYERYLYSGFFFFVGTLVICYLSQENDKLYPWIQIVICIYIAFISKGSFRNLITPVKSYEYTVFDRLVAIQKNENLNYGSYLIYAPSTKEVGIQDVYAFFCRYQLFSSQISVIFEIDENLDYTLPYYDHFIVLDNTQEIQTYLNSHEISKDNMIGHYETYRILYGFE